MANRVYSEETITLQDDTEVVLAPLPIARLRRFMDAWAETEALGEADDATPIFINCSGIALEKNFKGKFDSLRANTEEKEKGKVLSAEYEEYLEDTLELPSIYKILEVCGNIKLNDPKLMEIAMEATAEQERHGKN